MSPRVRTGSGWCLDNVGRDAISDLVGLRDVCCACWFSDLGVRLLLAKIQMKTVCDILHTRASTWLQGRPEAFFDFSVFMQVVGFAPAY